MHGQSASDSRSPLDMHVCVAMRIRSAGSHYASSLGAETVIEAKVNARHLRCMGTLRAMFSMATFLQDHPRTQHVASKALRVVQLMIGSVIEPDIRKVG